MTREEAIEIEFKSAFGWVSNMPELEIRRAAAETIDCYVALGMIKLDEPKSIRSKTLDALLRQFSANDVEIMFGILDGAGLKIVEA